MFTSTFNAFLNLERFPTITKSFLENLFVHLLEVPETQKIILWEISEKSTLMRDISAIREKLGSELFALIDPTFEKSDMDIRAVYALLLGGIYYLVLHSNATGGSFCEIDIAKEEGKKRIIKSLDQIMNWVFEEVSEPQ